MLHSSDESVIEQPGAALPADWNRTLELGSLYPLDGDRSTALCATKTSSIVLLPHGRFVEKRPGTQSTRFSKTDRSSLNRNAVVLLRAVEQTDTRPRLGA